MIDWSIRSLNPETSAHPGMNRSRLPGADQTTHDRQAEPDEHGDEERRGRHAEHGPEERRQGRPLQRRQRRLDQERDRECHSGIERCAAEATVDPAAEMPGATNDTALP